jgi:hypothetical protein
MASKNKQKNEVREILASLLRQSGLSRSQFVALLGYTNTHRGCNELNKWLSGEVGSSFIIESVVRRFPEYRQMLLQGALEFENQSLLNQSVDHETHFQPYIFIESIDEDGYPRIPRQISLFLLTGGLSRRRIILPSSILAHDGQKRIEWVCRECEAHFLFSEGQIPLLGPITGYSFRSTVDLFHRISIYGIVLENCNGVPTDVPPVF